MKKTKIIVSILFLILIIVALTGCKEKAETLVNDTQENEEIKVDQEMEENEVIGNTKVKKLFDEIFLSATKPVYIKYKVKLDTGHEQMEDALVTYATKNGVVYMDTVTGANRATILQKDGKVYTIMHDSKSYMEMFNEENRIDNIIDQSIIENPIVETGKETIEGKEYEYEKLRSDGEYNTFYYSKGTDVLKYWKLSDGQLLVIEEYGNDVNESLFEIPANYTEVGIYSDDMMTYLEGIEGE